MHDEAFIQITFELADLSASQGYEPFGAVLVKNNEIVFRSSDKSISYSDPTSHAELILISEFCRKNKLIHLEGYTLYCNVEPCVMCSGAIHWAKLSRVVFSVYQKSLQTISKGKTKPACEELINTGHKKTEIVGGILEQKGLQILQKHPFQSKQKKHAAYLHQKSLASNLVLRSITRADCQNISDAFQRQGWKKPVAQYENYVAYQENGARDIILAEWNQEFAGYLTINWQSDYTPFREKNIPEIVDFNVLKKFQRKGIGTRLMDEAERRIKIVSEEAGIGFGLLQDYGAAQILYINRGYIPDGNGMVKDAVSLQYGDVVTVGDDLVMYLTKKL